jgi:hypothetical protein
MVWSNGVSERFTSLPQDPAWRKIRVRNSTLIKPRVPGLELGVDHRNPALTSEYFPLCVSVASREPRPLRDLVVSLSLTDKITVDGKNTAELYGAIPLTPTAHHKKQSLELFFDSLDPGAKISENVFLSTHTIGERTLAINASYSVDGVVRDDWEPVTCVCQKSFSFPVSTVKPFDVTYRLMSTKFKVIDAVSFDEPFILVTEIHCLSPWKLYIHNSSLDLPSNVKNVGVNGSQIKELELGSEDKASEVWCLLAPSPNSHLTHHTSHTSSTLSFGTYTVQWRRSSCEPQSSVITSTVTLPPIPIHTLAFSISTDLPASGQLHAPFPISYVVHNRTLLVQEVEARISTSEAFMYSGKRHSRFRILPSGTHTLTYNLYPVAVGTVALPHLDFSCPRYSSSMDQVTASHVPPTIFIKPGPIYRESETDLSSLSSSFSASTSISTTTT